MTLTIKLMPYRKIEEMGWEEGMTVSDILKKFKWTSSPVYILVNGTPASEDEKLKDGDKIKLVLLPIATGG